MAKQIIVMGKSGMGKTTSLRNLNKDETLLVQVLDKPLPFKNDWVEWDTDTKKGQILTVDNISNIETIISRAKDYGKNVIVVDDMQYLMTNAFMSRIKEKGYEKFSEMGYSIWHLLKSVASVKNDVRVYYLWHTDVDNEGYVKPKTIGKLLDEKVTIEGLVTIVLSAEYIDGRFVFITKTLGNDATKAPMEMFSEALIDNDLAVVDKVFCEYYNIKK